MKIILSKIILNTIKINSHVESNWTKLITGMSVKVE